ncbi:MAG: M20/M25/M40 family metallo-hydrolase [Patescibacteria group bacterium]
MSSTTPAEQLLLELLAIPSVSGTEAAVVDWLAHRLGKDFVITRIPAGDGRDSLLCLRGTPRVLLCAHIDTVPGVVAVRTNETAIFGRGACDNKGAAAAMIVTAEDAAHNGQQDFGLLFTVGEETTFDGAMAVAKYFEEQHIKPDRIIIGEPTDLKVVTGQRGIYVPKIECTGIAEHSSTDTPNSAIHKLVNLLSKLLTHSFPETTYHVGLIQGGTADNVVAGHASATLAFRSTQTDIKEQVEAVLAEIGIEHTLTAELDIKAVDHTPEGQPKQTVSYFTEMALLPNSFVVGPGSIKNAHTDNEFVSRSELNQAVELYKGYLNSRS